MWTPRQQQPKGTLTHAQFVASIPASKAALEVGALDKPILNPNTHGQVFVLDVKGTEELRRYYANDPNVNTDRIVSVDYVWSGEPYSQLIDQRFETIVTSHNIEHQPDLVRYLNDLSSVLTDTGSVYLVVPDHRYCFDARKSPSTIVDVLGAHLGSYRAPTPTTVLVNELFNTHNDAFRHWHADHGRPVDLKDVQSLQKAYMAAKSKLAVSPYVDAHVWTFTPFSLCEVVHMLGLMGLTDLYVASCSETRMYDFEFYVVLQRRTTK